MVGGRGGGFAEALQRGDALPRPRGGEATRLLGNLAGGLAFLQVKLLLVGTKSCCRAAP